MSVRTPVDAIGGALTGIPIRSRLRPLSAPPPGAGPDQTVKLSPQPHMPLALGFWKTKPAVKSSSTQSIVEPTR